MHVAGLIFTDGQMRKLLFVRKDGFWVLPGGESANLDEGREKLPDRIFQQSGYKVAIQGLRERPVATHGETAYFQGSTQGRSNKARFRGVIGLFTSENAGTSLNPDELYEADRVTLRNVFGWPV